jgi:hypothetical protein
MKRYWIEFENIDLPPGIKIGCGVTAYNYDDAMSLIALRVFKNKTLPKIMKAIENVDVSDLDKNHVLPNMSPPNLRGVWFPLGYQEW